MITINTNTANIANWDFATSVAKVRGIFIGSWRKVSTELLEELYQAKLQLNRGPGNPGTRLTWKAYVEESLGVTVRTVDTWLKRHEIGEEAWQALQATKAKSAPEPKDDDALFIVKKIANKDGTFTVRLSLSEYPDTIFEETISA